MKKYKDLKVKCENLKEQYFKLEEENRYLKSLVGKIRNNGLELKKENIILSETENIKTRNK